MMNLSTLFFLVHNDSGAEEDYHLSDYLQMNDGKTDEVLLAAPDIAVRKVLGFASAYATIPSDLLDEIELMKN